MPGYTDAEHIQHMIAAGQIDQLPCETARLAEEHLAQTFSLARGGTIIDWDSTPHLTLNWSSVSDETTAEWSQSTIAGRCQFGLLLFSSTQACLIGSFDFMIRHLDELIWKAPGCRLLLGVERQATGDIVFTRGVIEFNGRGELFAAI